MSKLPTFSVLALLSLGCDVDEVNSEELGLEGVDEGLSAVAEPAALENGDADDGRCGVDVAGWSLEHDGGGIDLPEVVVPPRSTILVTEGASRAELEGYWEVTLGQDVLVVQGEPVVTGSSFMLLSDATVLDGPTRPFEAQKNHRRRGNAPGDRANAWQVRAPRHATPGGGPTAGPHIRISEIAGVPNDAPDGVAYVEIYVGGGWTDTCGGTLAPNTDEQPRQDVPTTCQSDDDCVGHPDGAACHPFGHYCGVDISDYGVIQSADPRSRYFATPTIVPSGTAIVLSRSGTQADFEASWATTLGPNAIFVATGGTFPAIDGDETYLVQAPGFVVVDGPTPSAIVHGTLARDSEGWAAANPTPGIASCDEPGLWLSEISDTAGDGYDDHEFVELCVGPPT